MSRLPEAGDGNMQTAAQLPRCCAVFDPFTRLVVFLHHWILPLWQLRQWPQVMCPSPLTR